MIQMEEEEQIIMVQHPKSPAKKRRRK